jgi:hypothetical protein
MKLEIVPKEFIDKAWKDGAHQLSEACDVSGGEITGDQLKMILSQGGRMLVAMKEENETVGWGVVRVDQLPNVRALHICELFAPDIHFERFFAECCTMATAFGCSEVRCSADKVKSRLYQMKCGFQPIYTTLRVKL